MYRYFFAILFSFNIYGLVGQQATLVLPIGHTDFINSTQFSNDGKKIVTSSKDRSAKVWDTETGNLLVELLKHRRQVLSAEFNHDNKKIVTSSEDSTAILWDAISGNALLNFTHHTGIVNQAKFNLESTKVVTASADSTAMIWDIQTGKLLSTFKHDEEVQSAQFILLGKKIITCSRNKSIKIWDVVSKKLLIDIKYNKAITSFRLSSDAKKILVSSADSTAKIWSTETGKPIISFKHPEIILSAQFNPDEKKILISSRDSTAKIWDAETGNLLVDLKKSRGQGSIRFTPDGKKLLMYHWTGSVAFCDAITGNLLNNHLQGNISFVKATNFTPDGKKLIITFNSKYIPPNIYDLNSGLLLASLKNNSRTVTSLCYSPDGKKILMALENGATKVFDTRTGNLQLYINAHKSRIVSAQFSNDGKKILTASSEMVKIWDSETGLLLVEIDEKPTSFVHARLSPDGSQVCGIVAGFDMNYLMLWDTKTGAAIKSIRGSSWDMNSISFSPDGQRILVSYENNISEIYNLSTNKFNVITEHASDIESASFDPFGRKIVTGSWDNTAKIWDAETGKLLTELNGYTGIVWCAEFSSDGKKIVTASDKGLVIVWDGETGKPLGKFFGHSRAVKSAQFSPDGRVIITASDDNTSKIWDWEKDQLLYTIINVDTIDHLVLDKQNRFDGTELARNLLYYVCNDEVVDLYQLKDQLWVPNLVERIMKGEPINAKTLNELDICAFTPKVEKIDIQKEGYHFKILPRRGGLQETALYINGIEVKRYKKEELKSNGKVYELIIKKQELANYLIPGQENPVMIKAWTADNTISSRGLIIKEDKSDINGTAPNLYAVLVGVSDYKGDELDLKYAAKDATYMSAAISNASRKLLNTDGNEHVFTYNLTTSNDRYLLPEKNSIKKTLEEIGKKASANDILLIFFAGHGVMEGKDKKQFYFLTADASGSSAVDAIADVGISTNELTEWIKPANIKAQKRILIFDACNSGQAIRDFVQLGKPEQGYIAARNDEKGQQIKAIEKLNNQSGLIILAASASDQNAYEMGRYSQGLLTYSLLKVMKQQPEILENGKYLDVSNWLNAAKKMVSTLAEGTGARQEPQLNSNNNFNIGLIDEEVRDKIILAAEKPLFARSNFQNTDTKIDNLKFRSAIDKELMSISSRGINADITYSADYEGADAFALTGDYKINGDTVTVNVLLVKGGTEVRHSYEAKGKITELNSLISNITSRALDWLKKNK